ncbi:uncharacterized protein LOC141913001 [Tubulanus polymorphus]|uniref:uncharacterized protein LOC141913001 n=1 Tax=Tubulanus polymorphus TaxID=672921 RepID=UPI003DA4DE37
MDISISISIPLIAAVVFGELLTVFWYSDKTPWGRDVWARWGKRYFVTSIICDVALALLVQQINKKYFHAGNLENCVILGIVMGLMYALMEAPHYVYNTKSFSVFIFHALHKMALVFVIAITLAFFGKIF